MGASLDPQKELVYNLRDITWVLGSTALVWIMVPVSVPGPEVGCAAATSSTSPPPVSPDDNGSILYPIPFSKTTSHEQKILWESGLKILYASCPK